MQISFHFSIFLNQHPPFLLKPNQILAASLVGRPICHFRIRLNILFDFVLPSMYLKKSLVSNWPGVCKSERGSIQTKYYQNTISTHNI